MRKSETVRDREMQGGKETDRERARQRGKETDRHRQRQGFFFIQKILKGTCVYNKKIMIFCIMKIYLY